MPKVKLRMVCYENKEGIHSYYYLERSEANRIIGLLKIVNHLDEWTPLSSVCSQLGVNARTMLTTIRSLAMVKRLDIKIDGRLKTVAVYPIIFIKKAQHNNRNNTKRFKYLRPTVYVKRPHKSHSGGHIDM